MAQYQFVCVSVNIEQYIALLVVYLCSAPEVIRFYFWLYSNNLFENFFRQIMNNPKFRQIMNNPNFRQKRQKRKKRPPKKPYRGTLRPSIELPYNPNLVTNPSQSEKPSISKNPTGNEKPLFNAMRLPYSHIHPTFDFYRVSDHLPSANTSKADDLDDEIQMLINERLKVIIPRPGDSSNLINTVSKLMRILDRLKYQPDLDACRIDKFMVVGSLRMDTMLRGHRTADLVLILHTLPVKAALSALSNRIFQELQRIEPLCPYQIDILDDHLKLTNIFNQEIVKILIATKEENLKKLERDIHVRRNAVQKHLLAVSQMQWFENNRIDDDVKNLIRIMKDQRSRFKEFRLFSSWMVTILCHYSMTSTNDGNKFPINIAYRRILQLLSSGIFLPYSSGITDPCEPKMPIHGKLSVHDQEIITEHAQKLLRLMNYPEGLEYVFGFGNSEPSIQELLNKEENTDLKSKFSATKLDQSSDNHGYHESNDLMKEEITPEIIDLFKNIRYSTKTSNSSIDDQINIPFSQTSSFMDDSVNAKNFRKSIERLYESGNRKENRIPSEQHSFTVTGEKNNTLTNTIICEPTTSVDCVNLQEESSELNISSSSIKTYLDPSEDPYNGSSKSKMIFMAKSGRKQSTI